MSRCVQQLLVSGNSVASILVFLAADRDLRESKIDDRPKAGVRLTTLNLLFAIALLTGVGNNLSEVKFAYETVSMR
jgi:hypothetical protein